MLVQKGTWSRVIVAFCALIVVISVEGQTIYTERREASLVGVEDRLLLIRGLDRYTGDLRVFQQSLFDVWSSNDGQSWTPLGTLDEISSGIAEPYVTGFDGSVWMTGDSVFRPVGQFMRFDPNANLLRTENGVDWSVWSEIPGHDGDGIKLFGAIDGEGLVVVRGQVVRAPEITQSVEPTGAWISSDGRGWRELSTENRGEFRADQVGSRFFGVTNGFQAYEYDQRRRSIYPVQMGLEPFENKNFWEMVSFDGALYVVGGLIRFSTANLGFADTSGNGNEVWRSTDNGRTWTMITNTEANSTAAHHNPPFSYGSSFYPRSSHSVAVYQDHIYVVAGAGGSSLSSRTLYYQDVWRSPDGIQWEKVAGEDYDVLIQRLIEEYPAESAPGG